MKDGDMLDKGVSTLKKGALPPSPSLPLPYKLFLSVLLTTNLIDYNY